MTAVILVADGARPDTLAGAMDAGHLPTLAAMRDAGSATAVTSVFPSVTGPAYVPFLMGIHPGAAGVPGIRWWDRAGTHAYAHGNARSYVGFEALRQDDDLTREHKTLFELAERPLAAMTPIGRGLGPRARIGAELTMAPRLAWTHFRGDVSAWLRLERTLADRFIARVAAEEPDLAFFAHPCVDKFSHQLGHEAPAVLEALRVVDETAARLRDDAARRGRRLDLIVVSDHGHSPVSEHDELVDAVRELGHGVLAHPWTFAGGTDVAVMVGGNAMAHLYVDLDDRRRRWWPRLAARWEPLAEAMLARASVELLLLPHGPHACEVRSGARGSAMLSRDARGLLHYHPGSGDPLGLAAALGASGALEGFTDRDAYDATRETDHPDSLVQVLALAGSARAGDLIVSAAPGWDLRERWEPIPHVSTHGSLRREHMLVPLLTSFTPAENPRTTADVFRLSRSRSA